MAEKRAQRRKFHYIYKITRFDGKYYIGMHSTDNLKDGYFGSGTYLAKSKTKHGLDNHFMEILEFLPDRESLKIREKELVCKELLEDSLCMNLTIGGGCGWEHVLNTRANLNSEKFQQYKNSGRLAEIGRKALKEIPFESKSRGQKKKWKTQRDTQLTYQRLATEAATAPCAVEKRKATFAKINHMQGEKNSQFGKRWIHNLELKISKRILKEEPLPFGYKEGRKLKFN